MTHYKIVKKSDLSIVASYDDVNPYGGTLGGSDGTFVSLAVPDGVDQNGVVVHDDGSGNLSLIFDQPTLDAWQRRQNKSALDTYTLTRSAQAETDIQAALQAGTGEVADYTTHLMIALTAKDVLDFPSAWTQTIQGDLQNGSRTISNLSSTDVLEVGSAVTGNNVAPGTTLSQIFDEHSVQMSNAATGDGSAENISFDPSPVAQITLAAYRPVFFQVQAIRNIRDRDIAMFVPPYPSISPLYPS